MAVTASARAELDQRLESLRLADVLEDCWEHPAFLLNEIRVVDQRAGEKFSFTGMLDPEDPWAWQRDVLDWWMAERRTLILKARQLGVTYIAAGLALWYLLFKPGSRVLVFSIGEVEAKQVAQRIWMMFQSLPPELTGHVKPIKPRRTERVSDEIVFAHDSTTHSSVRALASTAAAGHGEVAALAILDEFAYNENAVDVMKAVIPATSGGGKSSQGRVIVISTANGTSGELEGANPFYYLYTNAEQQRLKTRFLGVFTHPDRDEEWYAENAMAVAGKRKRLESYPRTEQEAWQGTGGCWFDDDAMEWYRDRLAKPLRRVVFAEDKGKATLRPREDGLIRVYREPVAEHSYAIFVDPSGGSGRDFSAAYVLDLSTCEFAAEIYDSTIDPDMLAAQLHYLGRWYGTQSGCANDARLAVERTGGYGAVIITALRDGRDYRPPYTRLYRHRNQLRPDLLEEPQYGFPTTRQTRPQLVSALEVAIREKQFPYMTEKLFSEASVFGEHISLRTRKPITPSPSAGPGNHDDACIAAAGCMYLYGLYGEAPRKVKAVSRTKRAGKRLTPKPFKARRKRAA